MRISFIKKKVSVTLETIHEDAPSAHRDWAILIISLFVLVVLISLYSMYLFFSILRNDASVPLEGISHEIRPTINKNTLNKAVEFINSRTN